MSHSPEQKRGELHPHHLISPNNVARTFADETSLSPKMSPTQGGSTTDVIEITVHSVMDGVKDAKVSVPTNANVFELKRYICLATEVAPERQLLLYKDKELRDDDASISSYGIVNPCSLTMNVKMNTGLQMEQQRMSAAEMFFLIPIIMPVGNLSNLRNTIRTMTDVNEQNSGQNPPTTDENPSKWTPAKQMEHELTRNRMKKLLRKRRKTTILSNNSLPRSPGSVICRSLSEPTSPGEPVEDASTAHSPNPAESKELTEKELRVGFHWRWRKGFAKEMARFQCFFEPPESLEESYRKRHVLFTPPESVEELVGVQIRHEQLLKTTCKICGRRLPLPEQQMRCRCHLVFCRKHREPDAHLCQIDYKQTGRSKIMKENPKLEGESSHKAKMCD
ncbi:hypothetical protein Aduo_007307 [Ancylostoma duodenale]